MKRHLKPFIIYLFFSLIFLSLARLYHLNTLTPKAVQKKVSKPTVIDQKKQTIQTLMNNMTLEEKVGQLFWARLPKTNQIEDLQTYHLGGYILFGNDFYGRDLTTINQLTQSFQEVSKIPLLIGSDEEGGTVTRISSILNQPFESPMALYQRGGLEALATDSLNKAQLLKSVGINAGLFPVADLATDPYAFIYNRTIGEGAEITSQYIQKVVQALNQEKFGSTLKHFPGYGNNGDSHTAIIEDSRSLDSLRTTDFLPFKAGIDAGADSILVAHNILTEIEYLPASISPKINAILRDELGFKGVIMTDDLDMSGLANFISQEEAAYQVIVAGNDIIMGSQYQIQIPHILNKVASGELTEQRINQSVERILSWKYDLGLLK